MECDTDKIEKTVIHLKCHTTVQYRKGYSFIASSRKEEKRGDINRSIPDCLFGSEGGCLGEETFSAKKIRVIAVLTSPFQRISEAEVPPGGAKGRHSSLCQRSAGMLPLQPPPGCLSQAPLQTPRGKRHGISFHLSQRSSCLICKVFRS